MIYRLNPGLYVENGATILVERDRAARTASIAYSLLRNRRAAAETNCAPTSLSAAA